MPCWRTWWGKQTDINSALIGTELDNNGAELFADAKYEHETPLTPWEILITANSSVGLLLVAIVAKGRQLNTLYPSAFFRKASCVYLALTGASRRPNL